MEDCKSKVTVKCACKTIKKSFLCNEIFNKKETTIVECNEKCEATKAKKQKSNEEINASTVIPPVTDLKPKDKTNFMKILLALSIFILLIAILVYSYF